MKYLPDIVGLTAAFLTTFAQLPQLIKLIRSGSCKDISTLAYACGTTGNVLWLLYGFFTNSIPLVLSNSICLMLSGTILTLKLKG